jgi:hypothetical protein
MAIDFSEHPMRHVRLDDNERYLEDVKSHLNYCMTEEANLDQYPQAFFMDLAFTLFDKGVAAICPVDVTVNPETNGTWDILNMRVGEIVGWAPDEVRVSVYNEKTGRREEVPLKKKAVAIIYNPLAQVMNEPNSTLQRLQRKLGLLDVLDDKIANGKLDLIIQLPYQVKSEAKREMARQRTKEIEFQLTGSQFGIAYADATEKITQLNRPVENDVFKQVEYYHKMLYGQLGLTEEVILGTAEEAEMLLYYNRTIKPILEAVVQEMRRKFLTKTARTQKQSIMYFRDPFRYVPVKDLAEIADKFARNEIFTSNEIRQFMGVKPAPDKRADQLRNSNMPESELGLDSTAPEVEGEGGGGGLDGVNAALDEVFADIEGQLNGL